MWVRMIRKGFIVEVGFEFLVRGCGGRICRGGEEGIIVSGGIVGR